MSCVTSIRSVINSPAVIFTASLLAFVGIISCAAQAEDAEISVRRAAERTSFSDNEIKDGFFKTAFRAELQFDRPAERIRKFDEPIRVFVVNRAAPDRRADIAKVIADIRAHVRSLDVAVTDNRQSANFLVVLVQRSDLERTIRARYGAERAGRIQRALSPECLSGIGKDASFRIRRAEAILPVDAGEFAFYDCAYEELLQGLGIINDDNSVPWTMFNDDVQMGFFDLYDQYLVNILYDRRVRAGMTKDDLGKILPEVLPSVRAWVTNANSRRAQTVSSLSAR
jgi:hypothetical protein